jgi:DNA polymerase I-like protein with 3'-5' exonuclease and polymerase domains
MGAASLSSRIDQPKIQATHLLQLHRETYPVFWRWSDAAIEQAMLASRIQTVFGWTVYIGARPNERSLRNFPMQANGAEMLRLACCLMVEAGIEVCAPVHDAILILGPTERISSVVEKAKQLMEQASAEILGGFRLRSDEKIVSHPDRYMDERGLVMWKAIWELIEEIEREELS